MISLLLLASAARCVTPALCPTDEQLMKAVRLYYAGKSGVELSAIGDDSIHIYVEPIKRISDVLCGDEGANATDSPPVVTCNFTARYSDRYVRQTAELQQRDDGWEIIDTLTVTRRRR